MDWHLIVHCSEAGVLVVVLSFIISASPWSGNVYPQSALPLDKVKSDKEGKARP
jgi:hypothetical protein